MNKIWLTLTAALLSITLFSQELQFEYQTGIGHFKMTELKTFLKSHTGLLPFDPVLTDDFPRYFFHHPSILVSWNRFEAGLTWTHTSTGARYSLQDYSGEYLLESRLKANGPGLLFNLCLNPKNRIGVLIGNRIGWLATRMTLIETLYLNELKKVDEEFIFRSGDVIWEPGIKVTCPISVFQLHLYSGYSFMLQGKGFHTEQDGEKIPLNFRGEPVHAGWSGLRWGGGVAVSFSRLNHL